MFHKNVWKNLFDLMDAYTFSVNRKRETQLTKTYEYIKLVTM